MHEELSFDRPLTHRRQADLIRQYCKGLDERIRAAKSKEQAERLVNETCQHFERTCESKVVRSFLKRYVHNLFVKSWNQRS